MRFDPDELHPALYLAIILVPAIVIIAVACWWMTADAESFRAVLLRCCA